MVERRWRYNALQHLLGALPLTQWPAGSAHPVLPCTEIDDSTVPRATTASRWLDGETPERLGRSDGTRLRGRAGWPHTATLAVA